MGMESKARRIGAVRRGSRNLTVPGVDHLRNELLSVDPEQIREWARHARVVEGSEGEHHVFGGQGRVVGEVNALTQSKRELAPIGGELPGFCNRRLHLLGDLIQADEGSMQLGRNLLRHRLYSKHPIPALGIVANRHAELTPAVVRRWSWTQAGGESARPQEQAEPTGGASHLCALESSFGC